MGQSSPVRSPSAHRHYLVGRDEEGRWVVRDQSGARGGVFLDKNAAVRFACFETERRPDAVLFVPEHITLPLAGALPRL